MDINAVKTQLDRFHQAVSRVIPVERLVIFGSYLEGRATADSDVDVVVISLAFNRMSEDERLRLLDPFGQRSTPPIEAWGFTPDEFAQASPLTTLGYAREAGYRWEAGEAKVTPVKATLKDINPIAGSLLKPLTDKEMAQIAREE